MKKLGYMITLVMFLFMVVLNVSAKEITLKDVIEKVKTDETFNLIKDDVVITNTDNSLTFTYQDGDKKAIIPLSFQNGTLSYQYTGNKTNLTENDMTESFINSMIIVAIASAVAELNGYDAEQLKNVKEEDLTFEKNGMEMTTWSYKQEDESGHFSMTVCDTFRISLNSFNIEGNPNPSNPNGETKPTTPNEEVNPENPNTGVTLPIIGLSCLIIGAIISLNRSKKQAKFIDIG